MADATCSIPGCADPVAIKLRGWCKKHYHRWQRYGDPVGKPPLRILQPLTERFWSHVNKTEGCWLWTAGCRINGYGCIRINGRTRLAHHVAYELLVGPIPEGLTLDHVRANGCTSTLCVKAIADEHGPAHLEPVTAGQNALRGDGPAARNARKTHCPKGHPYDLLNTRFTSKGWRQCRTCQREWAEAHSRTRPSSR